MRGGGRLIPTPHTPPFSALTIRIIVIQNICTERNCVARVTNSPSQIAIMWQGQDLDLSCPWVLDHLSGLTGLVNSQY